MRHIYNILFYLLVPFILVRLLWRSRKAPKYRKRWKERFGLFDIPQKYQNGILIHSVSVGETVAAIPLIHAIQAKYPDLPITVTTMTVTGSERVKFCFKDSVFHTYIPYDLPCTTKRFLKKLKPRLTIIMETELWPNLIYYCRAQRIPLIVANARLSEKSFKKYARVKFFITDMLQKIDMIAAQAKNDAKHFEQLGMPPTKITITGSIKFDVAVPASVKEAGELLRQQLGASRSVWIAASTHEGEDEYILDAFAKIKKQIPDCLLLLVPRHPERFNSVASLCKRRKYKVVLRSSGKTCKSNTDVYLGDTMGEVMQFFAASDVSFIGGSLVKTGGHNLLEPALFSLPVISGPNTFNFTQITYLLQQANALIIVENAKQLAENVIKFLEDPKLRQEYGERAQTVVDANRGAVKKHMQLIEKLLH